jgi:DNA-binding LacI/PurR family transcriptional regulator
LGEKIKALMKQGVTAIMAEHDEMAFQILMACKELNISVPRDLSVCGFDDSEWAHMLPGAITTVSQDQESIGKHVAELLLDRMGGAVKPAQNIVIPTKLVVGTTTGECTKNGK